MIEDADLHAYADGRLPPARRAEVARHLARHPEDRRRVDAWRALDAELRALALAADEPVPERLLAAARQPRRWPYAAAAAAVALLLVGGVAGWFARPATTQGFAVEAAVAHRVFSAESRHAVEVTGAESDHLVTWLAKRLGGPVPAPDLSALGYGLVGGRLLSTATGPAAQLMYEDASGARMTLFYRTDVADEAEHPWRFAETGGVTVYYWVQGGRAFGVAGTGTRAELEAAGRLATP